MKVNVDNFNTCLDLHIFKKPGSHDQDDYQMYVLFEEGILLYNSVITDRRKEPHRVFDSANENMFLSQILSDCLNGILMVDVVHRLANGNEEHYIERFRGFEKYTQKHALEGQKQFVNFFKDYVIEVKHVTKAVMGGPGAA